MAIIEAKNLSKVFQTYRKAPGFAGALKGLWRRHIEETTAVRNISFQIEEGELVGFLGPNGAGKTTTLKMLAGLLFPTSGTASVLGFVPWERSDAYRRQFALLLGQKNQLWWDLPARDSLELNSKIYSIPDEQFRNTVGELSELLNVQDKLNVMVRELSLGERMKMELIAALLHRPKVLFLDEPTIGLDVVSQKTVRDFLQRHNQEQKTTIVLTSHYMADIQALCRRVIIIDHGAIFFDGLLSNILDKFAGFKMVRIQFEHPPKESLDALRPFGEIVEQAGEFVKIRARRDKVISLCKTALDRFPVKDLDIQEAPIEEVIGRIFASAKN